MQVNFLSSDELSYIWISELDSTLIDGDHNLIRLNILVFSSI